MSELTISKIQLRRHMLETRNSLSPDLISKVEPIFSEQLRQLNRYQAAKTVMLYMSFQNEAPTHNLIQQTLQDGKTLVLPYTDREFQIIPYIVERLEQLKSSRLGILEPNPSLCREAVPSNIDLILIPGVAFDLFGNRIGFGKGCYDRFLPKLEGTVEKMALAYDFQLVARIPQDPYDIPLDSILTESGWKPCLQSADPKPVSPAPQSL